MKAPTADDIFDVNEKAYELIQFAKARGLNVSIRPISIAPPAIGRHVPHVETWPLRQFTRPE